MSPLQGYMQLGEAPPSGAGRDLKYPAHRATVVTLYPAPLGVYLMRPGLRGYHSPTTRLTAIRATQLPLYRGLLVPPPYTHSPIAHLPSPPGLPLYQASMPCLSLPYMPRSQACTPTHRHTLQVCTPSDLHLYPCCYVLHRGYLGKPDPSKTTNTI